MVRAWGLFAQLSGLLFGPLLNFLQVFLDKLPDNFGHILVLDCTVDSQSLVKLVADVEVESFHKLEYYAL